VKFLCSKNIDINSTNAEGQTALHYGKNITKKKFQNFKIYILKTSAARMNYYKIVDELCFNEANVELADKDKRTPMNIGNSSKLE
jgi:hypothetical protein